MSPLSILGLVLRDAARIAAPQGEEIKAACDAVRLTQFPLQWLHPSRRIAEPVIGRAFARPGGDAPQDEVSDPHGEERVFARLRTMLRIAGRTMRQPEKRQ